VVPAPIVAASAMPAMTGDDADVQEGRQESGQRLDTDVAEHS